MGERKDGPAQPAALSSRDLTVAATINGYSQPRGSALLLTSRGLGRPRSRRWLRHSAVQNSVPRGQLAQPLNQLPPGPPDEPTGVEQAAGLKAPPPCVTTRGMELRWP